MERGNADCGMWCVVRSDAVAFYAIRFNDARTIKRIKRAFCALSSRFFTTANLKVLGIVARGVGVGQGGDRRQCVEAKNATCRRHLLPLT